MTTKHTPGRLYRDERASHAVVRLDGERNGYVDPIVAEFWDDYATIEEAEANADLYIAAPELVERLQELTGDQDIYRDNDGSDLDDIWRCRHCGVEVKNTTEEYEPEEMVCHNPDCPAVKARALLSRIEKGE